MGEVPASLEQISSPQPDQELEFLLRSEVASTDENHLISFSHKPLIPVIPAIIELCHRVLNGHRKQQPENNPDLVALGIHS